MTTDRSRLEITADEPRSFFVFQNATLTSQAIGGDHTSSDQTPLSPRQEALRDLAINFAGELAIFAALASITAVSSGTSISLTALRMGLGVSEMYSIVHNAMQIALVGTIPEKDIAGVRSAFDTINLQKRATTAAFGVLKSISDSAEEPGKFSNNQQEFVVAIINNAEAALSFGENPRDHANMIRLAETVNQLFEKWKVVAEDFSEAEADSPISEGLMGLRLIDDRDLISVDLFDLSDIPKSSAFDDSNDDDFPGLTRWDR